MIAQNRYIALGLKANVECTLLNPFEASKFLTATGNKFLALANASHIFIQQGYHI